MNSDKIDPSKNTTNVPPKDGKAELAGEELAKVTGGVTDLGKQISKVVDDAISAAIGGNTGATK